MSDFPSVLTLRDLDSWSFAGTALAVLGHPIKHSISPALHHGALAAMARTNPRFLSWSYFRFDVPPAELPQALKLLHARKFLGLNLTVPHKVLAVPHLAAIDPRATEVGAVNTLRWTERGWHGYNTDGYGLATGLRDDLRVELAGTHVILLGAGGAARGAAVECLQQGCASLSIGNRTPENLAALLTTLRSLDSSVPLRGFSPADPPKNLPHQAIVINATSAGLKPGELPPIDLRSLPAPAGVYDMIYNPPETALLRAAATIGVPRANGLSMLVHQGAKALSIWSEMDVPVDAMRVAAQQALPT
ncbi:MAG: shikimate dehydrogenase [Opitutus sp.]